MFVFCSQTLPVVSNHHFIAMSHLNPAATYCAKVRSIYSDMQMTTDWSKWSRMTCWETPAGEGKESARSSPLLPSWTVSTADSVSARVGWIRMKKCHKSDETQTSLFIFGVRGSWLLYWAQSQSARLHDSLTHSLAVCHFLNPLRTRRDGASHTGPVCGLRGRRHRPRGICVLQRVPQVNGLMHLHEVI